MIHIIQNLNGFCWKLSVFLHIVYLEYTLGSSQNSVNGCANLFLKNLQYSQIKYDIPFTRQYILTRSNNKWHTFVDFETVYNKKTHMSAAVGSTKSYLENDSNDIIIIKTFQI